MCSSDLAARRAVLDPADLASLHREIDEHRTALDTVAHDLRRAAELRPDLELGADERLDDALPTITALVGTAEARAADTATALASARQEAALAAKRCERLVDLVAQVEAGVSAWLPVHADHARTVSLSAFVEGKSPDNRLQMRLSAYVLAYRLAQVVAAANERLVRMTDQRYRLEHTAERGARDTRGGLGLLVRDDWSGEARDPATLSGGETFVVSLALALGLADVIGHEAGGAAIETLFVDEGFGSLDADTLDDVMDTLDSLRDGGRIVGVVSHVAEMRDRIPTQIVVEKSRAGSTARVRMGPESILG